MGSLHLPFLRRPPRVSISPPAADALHSAAALRDLGEASVERARLSNPNDRLLFEDVPGEVRLFRQTPHD